METIYGRKINGINKGSYLNSTSFVNISTFNLVTEDK